MLKRVWVRGVLLLAVLLAACSSDDDVTILVAFSVGGTVEGLSGGSVLIIRINGSHDLALADDGSFDFGSSFRRGERYDVTIASQPDDHTCTVGNGSGTVDGSVSDVSIECESHVVTGVAAAGARVVGVVNVKGANGATASSPIDADGRFRIDVLALTAPYVLFARGAVGGRSVSIYSATSTPGTVNITTITDFILRNAVAGSAAAAFENWTATPVDAAALEAAEADARAELMPLLGALGVPADLNLITAPFDADHTGIDAALDALEISYVGNQAMVTNRWTGSSYVDDVTLRGDAAGLPDADEAASASASDDVGAIEALLTGLSAATTFDQVAAWVDESVTNDFLSSGNDDKIAFLDDVAPGFTDPDNRPGFDLRVLGPMDVSGTPYVRGFSVALTITTPILADDTSVEQFVFDGDEWLFHGNQQWVDLQIVSHMTRFASSGGTQLRTGFSLLIEDDWNYAFDRGAVSAVVGGPGLPAGGLVMRHGFPQTGYLIFGGSDTVYDVPSDPVLAGVPDNTGYSVRFCSEPAADLASGNSSCTALQTYTTSIGGAPIANSDLDRSLFPELIAPATHERDRLNFGSDVIVSWSPPPDTRLDDVTLFYTAGTELIFLDVDHVGDDSVTFDTAGLPAPTGAAGVIVTVKDAFGREFATFWQLDVF